MSKIILVDGYSIINRAFYGVPMLTNAQGQHTNAVYGFLNILFKILEDEQPSNLAVAFDVKKPTFRHEMFDMYKGTRKPMPVELTEQVPYVKEVLGAMGITCLEKPGYEADDILGTVSRMAEREGYDAIILSGDRDLLQVATKKTKIFLSKTSKGKTEMFVYDEEGVKELYGVTPTEFIDMKALMGDSSDNIPGLPGVGEKTAGALIARFHSIENCMANIDEVTPPKAKRAFEEHFDQAVLSKKLATIELNAPVDVKLDDTIIGNIYTAEAYELIKKYNFKSMFSRFEGVSASKQTGFKEPDIKVYEDFGEALGLIEEFKKETERPYGASVISDDDNIYGIALCKSEEEVAFIECGFFTNEAWIRDVIYELLKCGLVWTDAKKVFSYLEGDARFEEFKYFDTGICAYLINPLQSTYGYEEIAAQYLGITIPGTEELLGKHTESLSFMTQSEQIKRCCALNAYSAYLSFPVLCDRLKSEGMYELYTDIELPTLSALYRMQCRGIRAVKEELKKYSEKLSGRIDELTQKIYEEAQGEFNINSPKQLGEVLFEKLGLPGGKKTKSGYSTAADVLDKLAADYPLVKDILEYRQLTKLKSTYADGLAQYIGSDGRIHGTFNQTITATGRISSTDPNLQNIPVRMELGREIRKLFIPAEGCVFVDADYSQIELRVLAHLSGDEALIEAYKSAKDIHAITASTVFHVPLDEVTPLMRRNAKAVNFGIVYGISAFGLSEDLSITRKEATQYIERYFESYPGIKAYLDMQVENAKKNGYVTTIYGRRRPVPEIKESNFMRRQFGERVAMNSPIQGSAADIMKIAMLRVEKALCEAGLKAKIILQVHDELLIETPEGEVEAVKELLIKNMRDSFSLKVPLEIGISTGSTWYETK
ncbi:MAG: DNA polymerase I [Lachnospiraceae bacterium]|nr:DNA polymerase I [Lachnospiraceae bacterium]